MILKNKLTKKTLDIPYSEFRKKFSKEIQVALESYLSTENNKPHFKPRKNSETDFYFDLQWNFNHFGNSIWYIEKI